MHYDKRYSISWKRAIKNHNQIYHNCFLLEKKRNKVVGASLKLTTCMLRLVFLEVIWWVVLIQHIKTNVQNMIYLWHRLGRVNFHLMTKPLRAKWKSKTSRNDVPQKKGECFIEILRTHYISLNATHNSCLEISYFIFIYICLIKK